MRRTVVAVLVASGASACATVPDAQLFAGPARPMAEVGMLRTWSPLLVVEKVDGQAVGDANRILVLPGPHTVSLKFSQATNIGTITGGQTTIQEAASDLQVSVEPGHAYVFRALPEGQFVRFLIEDLGTGYDPACFDSRIAGRHALGMDIGACKI